MSALFLLFLLFLGLKLGGVITWSWWLVTLPLWGELALDVCLIVLGAIGIGIGSAASKRKAAKRRRSARSPYLR